MSDEPIDIEAEAQAQAEAECRAAEYEAEHSTLQPFTKALTVRDAMGALEKAPAKAPITAAQAKIEAVADLTAKAYARASELKLTPEEIKALQEEFPDEAFKSGAAGKENLIYIEHAFLRDRLNQVIGPGQWALIPRSRWGEDFSYQRQQHGKWITVQGTRIYVESMLMVRGCFVAEAIGEMEYYPKNAGSNYGDAVEGAKTAALRRCCKEFGIGLQAWKKDWCEAWWQRRNAGTRKPAAPTPTPMAEAKSRPNLMDKIAAAASKKPEPHFATEKTREWMIQEIGDRAMVAREYAIQVGLLLDSEELVDWPLDYVPINKDQLAALLKCIQAFEQGDQTDKPYPPNPLPDAKPAMIDVGHGKAKVSNPDDPNSPDAPWRSFPMPWGKHAGTPLGDLDKKYLYGLAMNYEVETEYNGKPKKPETIAKDQLFRDMLDQCKSHYGFTEKG